MSNLQTETLLPPDASHLSSLVSGSSNAAESIFLQPAVHLSEDTIISEFSASIKAENAEKADHPHQNGKSTQNNGHDEQEALSVLSSSHSSHDVEDALLLQELSKASRSPSVSTSNGTSSNMSTPSFDKPLKMKLKEENVKLPKKKRKTYLDEIQQSNGKQKPTSDVDDEREAHNDRNFEYVEENIYLGDSTVFQWKNLFDDDIIMCMCGPNRKSGEVGGDDHCGESCVNRVLCMECVLGHCACGSKCTNNRFQKKSWKKIAVKRAGEKGYGIFAHERIPKGSFIIEYVGEVLDEKIYKQRQEAYDGERHYYFLSVGPNQIIDASKKGNNARFINHSCDPNSVLQKWTVGHQSRIGVFALRDIEKGEEITFDYAMECYGVSLQKCYCGSKNCRGTITSKEAASLLDLKEKNSNLDKERNKRIKNHKLESKFKQRTLYTLKILEDSNKLPKDVQDAADFGNVCLLRNMRKAQQKRFRQFLSIEKQISDQFKQNLEEEKDEFGLTEYERAQMTKIYEQIQKGNINNLNVRGFNYRRCKTRSKDATTVPEVQTSVVSNDKPRVSVRGRKKSTDKMEDEAPKKRRGRPPKRKIEVESDEESSEDDEQDEEELSSSDDSDLSYDEESEEEEETSTRRKKKATSSSSSNTQGTTKRKVGRPRKHPLPEKPEEGKRKVGRPKKNISQPVVPTPTDANKPSSEPPASAPVKRRVGRPRKEEVLAREREEKERKRKEKEQRELQKKKEDESNKMTVSDSDSASEEEPPKRKVGRPKKNTTTPASSAASTSSKTEEKTAKRKVGRPKKEETLAKSTTVSSSKPTTIPQDQNKIKPTVTLETTKKEVKSTTDSKVTTLITTPTLTSAQSPMKSASLKIQNPFSTSSSSSTATLTTASTPTKKPITETKNPAQTPSKASSSNTTTPSSTVTNETKNETKDTNTEKSVSQQPVKRKVGRPKKEEVLAREKQKEQEQKEKKQEQEKPSEDKPVVKRPRKIVHNNASSSSNTTKDQSSSSDEESSSSSEEEKRTVKRKVGRPRKDENSSQQPKRKVGRPRKDQSNTNEARTAKKLGRPRKVIESSSESSSSEEEDETSNAQQTEQDADIEVARKFNIRLSKVKAYQGISTSMPKRKYTKHADRNNEQ